MKKLYALASVGIPLCFAAASVGAQTPTTETPTTPTTEAPTKTLGEHPDPPQMPELMPAYSLESQHIAMSDVGSVLERIGREIQQERRISLGGLSYPLSGFGGVEMHVTRWTRGERARTGVELHFGSDGRTTTPVGRTGQPQPDYDPYERGGRNWTPSALADFITQLGATLASTGTFVMDHHRVPFRGAARIDQRLLAGNPNGRYPYELEVHVLFGEGEFEGPDDDEDYVEDQEYGLIRSLARVQREDADRAAVAQMFATLAADFKVGRVRVGDAERSLGDTPVSFRLSHVTATDGSYEKIEFRMEFGPLPQLPEAGEARYGDDQFNEPITDLAAILQRLGGQILEDGTFEFDGQTFTAPTRASWEIYASPRGFAIEVKYPQPPEQ